jgi:hypothetical protein
MRWRRRIGQYFRYWGEFPAHWLADQGIEARLEALDLDSDGDGASNRDEFYQGTRANDPASCFKVRLLNVVGEPEISWSSEWGRWYVVDVSTNLAAGFRTVLGPLPGLYEDNRGRLPSSDSAEAFFRVRQVEGP